MSALSGGRGGDGGHGACLKKKKIIGMCRFCLTATGGIKCLVELLPNAKADSLTCLVCDSLGMQSSWIELVN